MRRNVLSVEQKSESINTTSRSPNTLDPDLSSSYFVIPRQNESADVSPSCRECRTNASKSPTAISQRSRRTQNTEKSAGSNTTTRRKNARTRARSIDSAVSASSKFRTIAEWNDKSVGASTGPWTDSSFESQRHPADPPRPARPGLEWVWFPEGYWAEREVRDTSLKKTRQRWWNRSAERSPEKSKRDSAVSKATSTDNVPQSTDIPEIKIGSAISVGGKSESRKSSKVDSLLSIKLDGFNFLKLHADTDIASQAETLGLYCRTKKTIKERLLTPRVSRTPKPSREESRMESRVDMIGWASRTTTVLEGAASYFNHQRLGTKLSASAPALPPSPEYRHHRRPFGLAPWHRKSSNDSFLSVSSSVHQILMGKTPAASPHLDRRYAGHEGRTYPKVEISSPDPNEPSFLPSEATRINTPPMSPGTSAISARGFFFDMAKAEADAASPATSAGSGSAAGQPRASPKSPPKTSPKASPRISPKLMSREWWDNDSKHTATGNKSSHPIDKHLTGSLTPSAFELSLPPDHLPSSPLCPKNPMHSSGGKGICPFHGRRKSVGLKVIKRVNTGNTSDSGTTGSLVAPYR